MYIENFNCDECGDSINIKIELMDRGIISNCTTFNENGKKILKKFCCDECSKKFKNKKRHGIYKLCYVENNFAYFTNLPLDEQWGDDWDDTPYEHNAGEPYCDEKDQIIKIAFDSDLHLLKPNHDYNNSPYSVQDINDGEISWLRNYRGEGIYVGASIEEFKKFIWENYGDVYAREEKDFIHQDIR